MSSRAQVAAALAVILPVALSGIALVLLAPGMWWIFTAYFWISFPSVGLLARGLAGVIEESPRHVAVESRERELLGALREHGELSPALAAVETSLSVAEAEGVLRKLAEGGHLEVRVRGGGIFYALWESEAHAAGDPTMHGEHKEYALETGDGGGYSETGLDRKGA